MAKAGLAGRSRLPIWIGFLLSIALVYVAKPVVVPLALAILLTFVLMPIVSLLEKCRIRRIAAVLLAVLGAFAIFGAVAWMAGRQFNTLAEELPQHKEKIREKMADLRVSNQGTFHKLLEMVRELSDDAQAQKHPKPKLNTQQTEVIIARPDEPSEFERIITYVVPVLEPLATAGFVVIVVIFMLINREDLRNRLISVLGHGHLTGTTRALVDAAERVSRYLLTLMLVNVTFGILYAIGLLAIGVPYAFLWGFLVAVLRFIPYIGTWIAVSFPMILSVAIFPDWTQLLLVLGFTAVLDLVTANAVEPFVFGHTTGVTPIALLIAAAFWTWLWGPIGLILTTPMTVCLVVMGQHIPSLRFLTLLMGNQPPMKPHINYYQRLLAKDVPEARRVALHEAKEGGLASLCDDVFLPALVLTRRDRLNNGLTAVEEEAIYQTTRDILALADQPVATATVEKAIEADHHRVNGTVAPAVLMIGCPAHDEAEELTLQFLASLVKSECRLEIISTKALAAEVEDRIREENPKLVFIAVLPPGGLLQARYLCRRLRKEFKRLPIVIGYWGEPKNYDRLLVNLRAAGASYVTTSLAQARSQIGALIAPPPSPRPPTVQREPAAATS